MKILFTGLPYFGKQLVAELNKFDPANNYIFCDTYYSKKDRIRFLWHLLSAKKVVSFNGATAESGSLNWVLRFKRKLILQWHGSDVLTAQENKISGKFTRKYVDYGKSFTDAPWLMNELKEMNIESTDLQFKFVNSAKNNNPFLSADILTYLGQGSETFYGIEHFLKLADEFKEINFHIVGADGKAIEQKPNVKYYGWVSEDEFEKKLYACAIFMRLTKHDGYSLSVLRAIANGNYVLWNNPHPAAEYVDDISKLAEQLKNCVEKVRSKNFERNTSGIDWAAQNLNREIVLQAYVNEITRS